MYCVVSIHHDCCNKQVSSGGFIGEERTISSCALANKVNQTKVSERIQYAKNTRIYENLRILLQTRVIEIIVQKSIISAITFFGNSKDKI